MFFAFGSLGDMLRRTRRIVCPCLKVETQYLFFFGSCLFMCCVEAWFVWWLHHSVDSIIDSSLMFLLVCLIPHSYFFSSFINFILLPCRVFCVWCIKIHAEEDPPGCVYMPKGWNTRFVFLWILLIDVSCVEAWFVWWLFHPVDSIIDSLLIFFLLGLVWYSYIFYYLHLSVSFYYLIVLFFMFGALGDRLMKTRPIGCPCQRVKT